MPTEAREEFLSQRALAIGASDRPVAIDAEAYPDLVTALTAFANAADPDRTRPRLRKPRADGTLKDLELANGTAASYLRRLRLLRQYGLDLLTCTAAEFNDFMTELVDGDPTNPSDTGRMARSTASQYQSAARAFYRFCTEPGVAHERPAVEVEWPADDILIFSSDDTPRHDEGDMFEDVEVDALREACVKGRNPRRDRAFIELLAGTCQRITAIRTLRVGDIHVDPDDNPPHILLNPEIRNDGDKGAIDAAGRWRPIVSDAGPVREWLRHHPLRDSAARREHDCPDDFADCYLFVGEIYHHETDPRTPWEQSAARAMLKRRKAATESLPNVATVTKPVDPHNFRHWGYSKSKELPIDEDVRRKVFGWTAGSDTGDTVYGHVTTEKAGKQFAEEWSERFGDGDGDIAGVTEQVVGSALGGDLSPEARRALAEQLATDEQFVEAIAAEITDAVE